MKKQQGFTLVEVTIILLVLVILSTIMLPQLGNYNRLARFVKAREDVGAICASMKKMLDEVMLGTVYRDPAGRANPVGLLHGPGDAPLAGGAVDGRCLQCVGTSALDWLDAVGSGPHGMSDDSNATTTAFAVGNLQDHLQQNQPNGAGSANRYKNAIDNPERWAAGAFFGWRGPYFDELTADPWGNRYSVNTFALYKSPATTSNSGIYTSAVVCYSAGPDAGIDTIINQPAIGPGTQDNGWVFGDDDLGAIMSAGGPF